MSDSSDKEIETELSALYRKRFDLKEKTLKELSMTLVRLKESAPKEIKLYYNIATFINVISYDTLIICNDIINTKNSWQRKHYSRQAALLIYETLIDIFELLGKDFRIIIDKVSSQEFESSIKEFRKTLNAFKADNFTKLQEIRNIATAHRDLNAMRQLRTILELDENYILRISLDFDRILLDLEKRLQQYCLKMF
jgi:hypothetical protein